MTETTNQTNQSARTNPPIVGKGNGIAARKSASMRQSLRISFESLFLDLLQEAPEAFPAETPEAEAPAPQALGPAAEGNGKAREAAKGSRPSSTDDAAPRRAAEAAPSERAADEAPAGAEASGHAEEAPRTEGAKTAESREDQAGKGARAERQAEKAAPAPERSNRLRGVEIEAKEREERPVSKAEAREIVRKIREVLEDADATDEEIGAVFAEIAQAFGIPKAEVDAALTAAEAEGGEAKPQRVKRALERIERALLDAIGGRHDEATAERAAPQNEPKAPEAQDRGDPLARLVRKVERAVEKVEAAQARVEDAPEAERNAPPPDLPRPERRADRAPERAERPQPVVAEAVHAAQAAVAPPSTEAPHAAHAARAKGFAIRTALDAAAGGVETSGRASAQARDGGAHFAFGEYGRNESQRARVTAEPRPLQYRSPVEEDVFREVIRRAKVVIQDGKSEAVIELKPEFLGRLKLNVAVENGKASVTLHAENAAVRGMLEANIDQLRKSLTESGLEVEMLAVSTGGAGFGAAAESGENNDGGPRHGGGTVGDGDSDDFGIDADVAEAETLRSEARHSRVSFTA